MLVLPRLPLLPLLRVALGLALVALGTACRATPPAAAVEAPFGEVRAASLSEAREVAAIARTLLPEVRHRLHDTLDRPVEIWVQERLEVWRGEPFAPHVAGMSDFAAARIHLRQGDPHLRLHLVHELGHVLAGPVWRFLPGALEEGLCDKLAIDLVPQVGADHHVKRLVEAAAAAGGVRARVAVRGPDAPQRMRIQAEVRLMLRDARRLGLGEVLALDAEEVFERATQESGVGVYGLGYLVAMRIVDRGGYGALRRLCEEARRRGHERVGTAAALRAAGLADRPGAIQAAVERALGERELSILARLLADDLAAAVLELGRPYHGLDGVDAFLESAAPEFGLPHLEARLRLATLPEFRDAVARRLADAGPVEV